LATNDQTIQLKADLFEIPQEIQKMLLAQENPISTYTNQQSKIVK